MGFGQQKTTQGTKRLKDAMSRAGLRKAIDTKSEVSQLMFAGNKMLTKLHFADIDSDQVSVESLSVDSTIADLTLQARSIFGFERQVTLFIPDKSDVNETAEKLFEASRPITRDSDWVSVMTEWHASAKLRRDAQVLGLLNTSLRRAGTPERPTECLNGYEQLFELAQLSANINGNGMPPQLIVSALLPGLSEPEPAIAGAAALALWRLIESAPQIFGEAFAAVDAAPALEACLARLLAIKVWASFRVWHVKMRGAEEGRERGVFFSRVTCEIAGRGGREGEGCLLFACDM